MIVDSHVHLWNPERFCYPWLDGLPALNHAFEPGDFSAASASAEVGKFIFVECGCEPTQSLAEVDWISTVEKSEPRLKGIIAHASLERGEAVRTELAMLASRLLVKGIRRNLQSERDPKFWLEPKFLSGLRLLAEFDFAFDLCICHEQLPIATELVRRVPEVTFVLDHLGKPDVRHRSFQTWANDLEALAALPNVAAKISGLATEAHWEEWQPADFAPYLRHAFTTFGPERLMFGSDWPVMTLATDYQRWIEAVQNQLPFSGEEHRIQFFQTNAERIYRV